LNEAQQPNQIWAMDFMHDRAASRSFRTFNVMDEANRKALGIDVGTSMPSERVVRYLNQLLEIHGKPQAIRCDNGPEFISQTMTDWAKERCIELKFIQPGKPNQNALIERFNRSFRTEVLSCYLFDSLKEVEELTQEWLYQYNHVRPHDALNGLTPVAFSEQF
jgi:putative transposase